MFVLSADFDKSAENILKNPANVNINAATNQDFQIYIMPNYELFFRLTKEIILLYNDNISV